MTTLNLQVNASGNDGYQNNVSPGAAGTITAAVGVVGKHPITNEPCVTGLRFTGVTIPKGATITSAILTVKWSATYSTANTIECTIYGEAADNAAIFTATNNNIRGRTNTAASVASGSVNNVTAEVDKTWNVTAIVKEIIARAGWASNNALAILLRDTISTSAEWQEFYAYDQSPNGPARCAKLDITYDELPIAPKRVPENVLLRM